MTDYISKEEAIDALRNAENHAFNGFYKGLIKAHTIIADIPSADVRENIKGKWIKLPNEKHICSNCGTGYANVQMPYSFNFCPNCGADMRRTNHETD